MAEYKIDYSIDFHVFIEADSLDDAYDIAENESFQEEMKNNSASWFEDYVSVEMVEEVDEL